MTDEPATEPESATPGVRWSVVAVAAVIAVGLGILGWNLWTSRQQSADQAATGATLVSHQQLLADTASLGHTVYWAGDQGLSEFELTLTGRNVYIRYLPAGTPAGSTTPALTVATYEQDNPYTGLEQAAKTAGAKSEKLGAGALLVQPASSPTSAYFAFPSTHLLMEVFDPTPGRAYELVRSGVITPLE